MGNRSSNSSKPRTSAVPALLVNDRAWQTRRAAFLEVHYTMKRDKCETIFISGSNRVHNFWDSNGDMNFYVVYCCWFVFRVYQQIMQANQAAFISF